VPSPFSMGLRCHGTGTIIPQLDLPVDRASRPMPRIFSTAEITTRTEILRPFLPVTSHSGDRTERGRPEPPDAAEACVASAAVTLACYY
jgi:hypothetical protein